MKTILQLDQSSEILRSVNKNLTQEEILTPDIQALIQEMKEIMREAPGVGLAAPQIGVNLNIAVIEDNAERLSNVPEVILKDRDRRPVDFHVIINPEIIEYYGEIKCFFEGCLSIHGKVRITPRYESVVVKCLDENAQEKIIKASGWYARILQHEIDHLNGQLYVDIADENMEMLVDENFKSEWMNAGSDKLKKFYQETKMLKALHLGSLEGITTQASRISDDVNAIVYKGNQLHEIAFFNKSGIGQFEFTHKFNLTELYARFCVNNNVDYDIRQMGDAVLHRAACDVKKFSNNAELEKQLSILKKNLYVTGGVGIAANQCVGIENPLKIILSGVDYDNPEHVVKAITRYQTTLFPRMKILINPVIVELDTELSEFSEGCLSVRGSIRGVLKRPKSVTVKYQDMNGEFHEENFTGSDARVMLHELDHILNGYVYLQRLIDELTDEQKQSLKSIVENALDNHSTQEDKTLFISPVTLFERDDSGNITFEQEKAINLFSEMKIDTLMGISSILKASANPVCNFKSY